MIILDTNVISEINKRSVDANVRAWLRTQSPQDLFATSISLAEILYGVEILVDGKRKAELRDDMESVFVRYFRSRILPFDDRAARVYGILVAAARARGKSILIADGQIAAIAHVHAFTVATRDTSPFEAAGVPVINPWMLRQP